MTDLLFLNQSKDIDSQLTVNNYQLKMTGYKARSQALIEILIRILTDSDLESTLIRITE